MTCFSDVAPALSALAAQTSPAESTGDVRAISAVGGS
jgi:hypothetical protein